LQDLARVGILRHCEFVGKLHRHLRGDDLRRVDRAGDRDDDLTVGEQSVALQSVRDFARIRELLLDVFVFFERQYILSRTDESDDQRPFQSGLAQRFDGDPIRGAVESSEVVGDLRPVGYRSIVARREPKD
jgi:hypothetical protein